ncbi:MAG TPA: hypothetical protein VJO53_14715 [Candidatus Acidoferrales bacterium]|nr:hypothetical protein [Candidatus Acidoferrales bacterium]
MPKKKNEKGRAASRNAGKRAATIPPQSRHLPRHSHPRTKNPADPAPLKAAPPTAKRTLPKRSRRCPRMSIGEALREKGIDEHAIAGNYAHVVKTLTGKQPKAGGVQKLLVDVLKECSRQIESARESERAPSTDAPVIVQLVHTVARPERSASDCP